MLLSICFALANIDGAAPTRIQVLRNLEIHSDCGDWIDLGRQSETGCGFLWLSECRWCVERKHFHMECQRGGLSNPEFKGNTFVSSYGRVYKSDFDNCFKDHGNLFLQSLRSTSGVCYSTPCQRGSTDSPSSSCGNWHHTANAAIYGHNNVHLNDVTIEQCKDSCCANSQCKSFDYYKQSSQCDLSYSSASDVGGLKTNYAGNPYDHYALDRDTSCPWGYNGISQNLDGSGKEFVQPHSDSSRTIQDCANVCSSRQGCTSFEFAIGNTETGACITYTGGDSNVRNDENRLSQDASWRSCVKETLRPTDSPSPSPTSSPTSEPTGHPSKSPSVSPTTSTAKPSTPPTSGPTTSPTSNPSQTPSSSPVTSDPTALPTTTRPTQIPSSSPVTSEPTAKPSISPSNVPTPSPTSGPTTSPTSTPSQTPSSSPVTSDPTASPTTTRPTQIPSSSPVTSEPTVDPTLKPTAKPSIPPSVSPTNVPTPSPTSGPTTSPTSAPSEAPTTNQPSKTPSTSPTHKGFEGSLCNADDECDSLRCNVGEFPYRCREKKPHSEECQKHSDCKSDKCLDGKCVDGRENDTCNSNDDCDSGRCAFGVPFGKCQHQIEHGSSCIRNNDCASGHCLLFACTDHRDGAHCVNDDDCVQGSSCAWSANGGKCKKNNGCTFWNWSECSEQCTWFQKLTNTCY